MVFKNQLKFVKSLQQKKYRNLHGMFVVEGLKIVQEFLDSDYEVEHIYTSDSKLLQNESFKVEQVTQKELAQISGLTSPNTVLGVFKIPASKPISTAEWILVLDDVRDPGNLGTIIRLCDWFGIGHLVCSQKTVDCYNPKVLQATMGSITRVNIGYTDLNQYLSNITSPVYGTFMDGTSVYNEKFDAGGVLIMGNEGKGISAAIASHVTKRVGIPQFGSKGTESLNVATATAIFLNEIRRP